MRSQDACARAWLERPRAGMLALMPHAHAPGSHQRCWDARRDVPSIGPRAHAAGARAAPLGPLRPRRGRQRPPEGPCSCPARAMPRPPVCHRGHARACSGSRARAAPPPGQGPRPRAGGRTLAGLVHRDGEPPGELRPAPPLLGWGPRARAARRSCPAPPLLGRGPRAAASRAGRAQATHVPPEPPGVPRPSRRA